MSHTVSRIREKLDSVHKTGVFNLACVQSKKNCQRLYGVYSPTVSLVLAMKIMKSQKENICYSVKQNARKNAVDGLHRHAGTSESRRKHVPELDGHSHWKARTEVAGEPVTMYVGYRITGTFGSHLLGPLCTPRLHGRDPVPESTYFS